ncbi:hypothetical protein D3C80_1685920 [compost metagenome]
MDSAPVIICGIDAATPIMAKVTIKGGTPVFVMMRPFTAPANAPIPRTRTQATGHGIPTVWISTAAITQVMATIEPQDRSIPPVKRTND